MIDPEHLQLIARLKYEPGYMLLCDRLQAYVDNMADGMAEDSIPSDERLQRVHEWRAGRKILDLLKHFPESILEDDKPKDRLPEELGIDPVYLARVRQAAAQAEDLG